MTHKRAKILAELRRLYGSFFKAKTFEETDQIVEQYNEKFAEFRHVLGKHYIKDKELIEYHITTMTKSIDWNDKNITIPNPVETLPIPIYEDSVYLNYANDIYIQILESKDQIKMKQLAARLMETLEEANHFWKTKK